MKQSEIDQRLFRAIERGDTVTVQELLLQGADVNARLGSQGKGIMPSLTPVWMNPLDMKQWTPLMTAINYGFIEIVRILLENGAELETEESGLTALTHAVRAGQMEMTRLLLKQGADIHATRHGRKSLLDFADWQGHSDILQLLLDHGSDINETDEYGNTALHHAARRPHRIEIARLLIQRGADMHAQNHRNDTPLWEALHSRNNTEMVTLFLEAGVHPTFREAAMIGDVDAGRQWIAAGTDINAPVWFEMRALELAIRYCQTPFAEMLIRHGAEIPDDESYDSLLSIAARSCALESIELLLTARQWAANSLLYAFSSALCCGDSRLSESIASHIQDWNPILDFARDDEEAPAVLAIYLLKTGRIDSTEKQILQQALMNAVALEGYTTEEVELLRESGAEYDSIVSDAIERAYSVGVKGNLELLELLLQQGADPNAESKSGSTAFSTALWQENCDLDLLKLLLAYGADMNSFRATPMNNEEVLTCQCHIRLVGLRPGDV